MAVILAMSVRFAGMIMELLSLANDLKDSIQSVAILKLTASFPPV